MSNPWDNDPIVKASPDKPWEKDQIVKAASKNDARPEEGTSLLDGMKNQLYGTVKGFADPVQGAGQLVLNAADKLNDFAGHPNGKRGVGSQYLHDLTQRVNQGLKEQEDQYQEDTKGSWAAGLGRVSGAVAPFLLSGGASGAGQAPRAVTLAERLAAGLRATGAASTQGAAMGTVQPVYNTGAPTLESLVTGEQPSYWDEKKKQVELGAVLGGVANRVGAGIGAGTKAAFNTFKPLVAPGSLVGDTILSGLGKVREQSAGSPTAGGGDLGGLLGDMSPQSVMARLMHAEPIIPGSQPTTAQVAGIPQLVMAEKALRTNPASAEDFVQRGINNNAARMQALRGVAQTPEALAAAIKARGDAAGPLYSAFEKEVLPLDPSLSGLLNTPVGKSAIKRAANSAQNNQEAFGLQPATAPQAVPSALLGADGMPISTSMVPGLPGSITGRAANKIKLAIDAMKQDRPVAGIESHEARDLEAIRSQLVSQLDTKSPMFKQARETWAQGSVPVNTMQAGQNILNGVAGLTHDATGDVSPMLSQYRTQLANALKNSKYGIDPEAQKTLEAVQRDLQRESISNSIRQPGSDTAFNLQAPNWLSGKLFGNGLDGEGLAPKVLGAVGGFLTGGPMGAYGGKVGAEKLGSFVGNRVNTQFQKAMLDPNYFAKLLGEALDRQNAAASPLTQVMTPATAKAGQLSMADLLQQNP